MAVYKRGQTWYYEFVHNGTRIKRSTKQRNFQVARDMEAAHRTALARGEAGLRDFSTPKGTVRAFSERFLSTIETNCDRPRTLAMYRTCVNGLLTYKPLADARLQDVDEAAVESFKSWRRTQQSRSGKLYAAGTINRELATLRRMLGLAHEFKLIGRVPRVRQLRDVAGRDFVVSRQLEAAYLGGATPQFADFAIVLLDAGLRVGEALSLEWRDIYLKPVGAAALGYLTIQAENAKGRKPRNVPLTPRLQRTLSSAKRRKAGALVFSRDDGKRLTAGWVQLEHEKLRRLLGYGAEFVPHSLRHTFGTRLGEAGADAFTIMRLMGHSSVVVSQRYVHPSPDALERAIQRMAGSADDDRAGLGGSEVSQNSTHFDSEPYQ